VGVATDVEQIAVVDSNGEPMLARRGGGEVVQVRRAEAVLRSELDLVEPHRGRPVGALEKERDALAPPGRGDVDVPLIPGVALEPMGAREVTELEPRGRETHAGFVGGAGERDLGREPRAEPGAELAAHLGGVETEAPGAGEIGDDPPVEIGLRVARQGTGDGWPERHGAERDRGAPRGPQKVAPVHRHAMRASSTVLT
jgi:hypothetical protein